MVEEGSLITMQQLAHIDDGIVVPFKGRLDRVLVLRRDITQRLDDLLNDGDDEALLTEYAIHPTDAERALEQDHLRDSKPDVPAAMASLRRCHRKSKFYTIEVPKGVSGCNVPVGQVLLVAPYARLQCLGLSVVAIEGQQPDLRFFVGKRDGYGGTKQWVFATDNKTGISIDDEASLTAAHPIIGVLSPAMKYDTSWAWTGRIAEILKTTSCRAPALNPRWRP